MGTTALAAQITIDNAVSGETYDVYKMLDFTPVEGSTDKGYYTLIDAWEGFFTATPASDYFEIETNADGDKIVTMETEPGDDAKAEIAKEAVAYAIANSIAATSKDAESAEVVFDGLTPGYYAIDTSLGTVCALVNADSTFKTVEKNAKPDITKEVQEDRNNLWGKVNDADIDQVVSYRSEITVGAGVTKYVMHDTMDAGLTFNADSIVVEGATEGVDYTVTTGCADGCTFEIAFTDEFIATVGKGNTFEVTYSATLNENAQVEYEDGRGYEGNKNTVYLEYFNETKVESDKHETVTYTWKLDVFKYTMDGANKTPLAGATFQLLKGGKAISFKDVTVTDGIPTYVVVAEGTEGAITDIVTTDKGDFVIIGLDEGAYTLTETNAPDGYNRAKDMEVVIGSNLDHENLKAEFGYVQYDEDGEAIVDADGNLDLEDPAKIEVLNKTGGLFPETGGIGTTIFYVVGALLMLAAVVILVSKKRMATFA